jgi:hypothetical protein
VKNYTSKLDENSDLYNLWPISIFIKTQPSPC